MEISSVLSGKRCPHTGAGMDRAGTEGMPLAAETPQKVVFEKTTGFMNIWTAVETAVF